MKKLLINLAVAAALLANNSPVVAQLVSTPLEAGMYTYLKETSSQHSYSVTLVDNNRLKMVPMAGGGSAWIEYLAPDNIEIRATVGTLVIQNELSLRDLQSGIDEYNMSAPVGTLKLDSKSGVLTMEHRMNPKHVGPTAMAKVAVKFLEALLRLQQRFGGKIA